ncbi:glutamyl aminopeptidase-like isoform X2 [Anticarsia gemmatalis]|uniref:glutamyl aminopeptidase-like isoform X2 n=1 Tax=Anticarsia gemmatalis TaxID=129554 RepID=UPI003F75BDC5
MSAFKVTLRNKAKMSNDKKRERSSGCKLLLSVTLASLCLFVCSVESAVQNKCYADSNAIKSVEPEYTSKKDKVDLNFYRLPTHIVPSNYDLTLIPHFEKKTFNGSVTITINVREPTKTISLHSNKLAIYTISLKSSDNTNIPIASKRETQDDREFLMIDLEKEISKGEYKLYLRFSGIYKGFVAFYMSTLKDGRSMVASKFEPTYARQAFPCFDEPDFKATYDIKLWKPVSYVALSNMNEISKTHNEEADMDVVTFATSVPMSTYLACFVICDFDSKETQIDSGAIGSPFTLRSFAQKHELHKIDFAQDIGKRATEFYIKYYEVPFPLPKLDMIAIPDYVSGATEHWGLITYRETSFLIDQEKSSASNKISVANTIAHELAHMWFGNLVTMKWWDEIWLNEGFASYMQVKALDNIEPTWKILDHFLTKTLHPVLYTDARLSSHPIVQTVATPDQITAIFDSISYNKGASILRMLEGFIGPENFRRGVSDYLKKYKFGNTVTSDLLSSLEPYFKAENPDLNLAYIMDTWTRQMGFPVLTVKSGDEPNSYFVLQSRFLYDPDAVYASDSNYRWFVPITYKTANGPHEKLLWLSDTAENIKIKLKDNETWLKINNNQVGYYRVNYTLPMWQTLIEQLKSKSAQLTTADRSQLLDDVFALAEARMVPYHLALNLTSYLLVENDYIPWETASSIYSNLKTKLLNSLAYDNLQKYFQRLIRPIYVKQNWDAENLSVMESLLRTRILSLAVRCQLPDAEERVKSLFLNWLKKKDTPEEVNVHQDLRDIVYFYGMKSASVADWDRLFQIYLKEDDVQEKLKLRKALSAPRDTTILRKFLILAWDETNIRSQDYLNVLAQISANPSGTALVWDDVRTRWTHLVDRFTLNSRYLGNVIPTITSTFNTELKYKEMEAFFNQYPEAGAGESARQRALENVRNNIRWNTYNLPGVASWLQANHRA